VDSVAGAIARMEAIEAALPAADGLACFNRMYLDVTTQVNSQLGLDEADQSIRRSFESTPELAADHHLSAVADLIGNWTINSARDLAWNNCLLLWAVRDDPIARGLVQDSLAASTALASQLLLVAV
jgi:hypothetical protein